MSVCLLCSELCGYPRVLHGTLDGRSAVSPHALVIHLSCNLQQLLLALAKTAPLWLKACILANYHVLWRGKKDVIDFLIGMRLGSAACCRPFSCAPANRGPKCPGLLHFWCYMCRRFHCSISGRGLWAAVLFIAPARPTALHQPSLHSSAGSLF